MTPIRLILAACAMLPLTGCFFYSDTPTRPTPVYVTPTPPSGTIVVQPQP